MSEQKKVEISIQIPVQAFEVKGNSEKTGTGFQSSGMAQEMPTITTLLQRKKLSAAARSTDSEPSLVARPPREEGTSVPLTSIAMPSLELSTSAVVSPTLTPTPTISSAPIIAPVAVIAPAPVAEIAVQPVTIQPISIMESPQVTPSRRRGTRSISVSSSHAPGAPPLFRGVLAVDSLELKAFQKMLKSHKKCGDMKKLDCIGYFSTRFSEIAYLQVDDKGSLIGILGFGSAELVTNIRAKTITPQTMPSIFGMLSQGESFVGSLDALRAEDQKALRDLGFGAAQNLGAFPMIHKKTVTGLWLCAARTLEEIPAKELKTLKKVFADLVF